MKKIELPINEIVSKYEKGITQRKIAEEYNVSKSTISKKITDYYEKIGKEKPKRDFRYINLPVKEIITKYEKGSSLSVLMREYGVSNSTIINRMNDYYKKIGKQRPKVKTEIKYYKKELPIEEIIKKYEEGCTILKLSEQYNASSATIRNRITKYYTILGKEIPKRDHTKVNIPIEDVIEKYESGILQSKIAEEYGVSKVTIGNKIKKYYKENGEEKPKKDLTRIKLPIEDIIKKYESGIDEVTLAEEYNVPHSTINKKTTKFYNKNGKKKPRILKTTAIVMDYLKKGLTIEEIIKTASDRNIIIPQDIISDALKEVNSKNITHNNEER